MPLLNPPPIIAEPQWTNRRILILLALGTLVVSLIWRLPEELTVLSEKLGELLVTLTFAAALTYLLRPFVNWLCRTHWFGGGSAPGAAGAKKRHGGRMTATLLVFLGVGLIIYGFCAASYRQVEREIKDQRIAEWFAAQSPAERSEMFRNWRGTLKTAFAPQISSLNLDEKTVDHILDYVPAFIAKVSPNAQSWASNIPKRLTFIVELLLLPVLVFYFLADGPAIRRETELLFPASWRPRLDHALTHFDRVFDGYVRGQVIMCVIAWVLVSFMLLSLHIPHWFTLGLIAGLTRAVPVIGPLLGGVPLVLVTFIETGDPRTTGVLLLLFTLMHFLESKVLLPRIIGHEVDLHPVLVIIALLVGLKFFGFLGVFLSVPFAAAGKIFLGEWHESVARKGIARRVASGVGVLPVEPPLETPHSTTLNGTTLTAVTATPAVTEKQDNISP